MIIVFCRTNLNLTEQKMKRNITLAALLIFSTVLSFAQTYSLKTTDGEKCTVTLDGDFVSITEPFFGGYLNKIVIPKKYFHSTSEKNPRFI